jgi:hypothetical protein
MNKKRTNEYNGTNRQGTKRRNEKMVSNVVHDREYTFADEYYNSLQDEYYESLKQELESAED